jgi:hypothetical protein
MNSGVAGRISGKFRVFLPLQDGPGLRYPSVLRQRYAAQNGFILASARSASAACNAAKRVCCMQCREAHPLRAML